MGVVSPCGHDLETLFGNLTAARSGVSRLNGTDGSADLSVVAAQVSALPSPRTVDRQFQQLDRATQFALVAADDAIADAKLELSDDAALSAGVYWGTGLGGATSIGSCVSSTAPGSNRIIRVLRPTTIPIGNNQLYSKLQRAGGRTSLHPGSRK